jgi:NADPH:quinone reductase-like Zn-dependent oxidoreductase
LSAKGSAEKPEAADRSDRSFNLSKSFCCRGSYVTGCTRSRKGPQGRPGLSERIDRSRKVTPVIDRAYPLSDVPEAIRYLEAGHARGKVVITL